MKLKKIVERSENIIYPNCHKCRKELSPYLILEAEEKYLELLKKSNSIIDYFDNKLVVLLCKSCCKIKDIDNG